MKTSEAIKLSEQAREWFYMWTAITDISNIRPEEERKSWIIECLSSNNEEFAKAQIDVYAVCSFLIDNVIDEKRRQYIFNLLNDVFQSACYVVELWRNNVDKKCELSYDSDVRSLPSSKAIINYIIKAADVCGVNGFSPKNAPQSTINEGDGQQPTKRNNIDEDAYNKALASPVMKALFKQDEATLKEFLDFCIHAKQGTRVARRAYSLYKEKKIDIASKWGEELYIELFRLNLVKIADSTWRGGFN